jgi:hypothetical protein
MSKWLTEFYNNVPSPKLKISFEIIILSGIHYKNRKFAAPIEATHILTITFEWQKLNLSGK